MAFIPPTLMTLTAALFAFPSLWNHVEAATGLRSGESGKRVLETGGSRNGSLEAGGSGPQGWIPGGNMVACWLLITLSIATIFLLWFCLIPRRWVPDDLRPEERPRPRRLESRVKMLADIAEGPD